MGSLTTRTKWTIADDILLKNAVEAGASLQSLAKGAVRFSQSFTVRELQERWCSILYNNDIGPEASIHVSEFTSEPSHSNPTKGSRTCSSKGKDSASTKRKVVSVRSHYYAKRKRISSEPRLLDPGYLLHPFSIANNSDFTCGDGLNFQNQRSSGNMSLGQDLLTCYGHPGSLYDEEMLRFNSVAAGDNNAQHSYQEDYVGSVQAEDPDEMMEHDCINRYNESTCIESFDQSQIDNAHRPFENDFIQKDPSQMLQENTVSLDVFSDDHEIRLTEILVKSNPSDGDIIETEALPSPGSNDEDHDGFTGNNNVSLQIPQYGHECPSPAVELPLWRAESDVCQETLSINMQCDNKEVTGVVDDSNVNAPGYDGTVTEGNMNDEQADVGLIQETSLMDFSMEFPEDDTLYFFDVDDKVGDPTSPLHEFGSILLNSPSDECKDDGHALNDTTEATKVVQNLSIPEVAASGETNKHCGQEVSGHQDELIGFVSGETAPSTSPNLSNSAEPCETLVCVLNTEDTEIPDNSDVVIPVQLASQSSASLNTLSTDRKRPIGETTMVKEKHLPIGQTSASAVRAKSVLNPGIMQSTDGRILGNRSFESGFAAGVSQDPGIATNDPKLCILQTSSTIVKEDNITCNLDKQVRLDFSMSSHVATPASASDHTKCYSQNIVNGCKTEIDEQAILANCTLPLHPEMASVVGGSILDQDDQMSESEDDVPSFSDVEAMILDMDLGPYDQESYFFTKEDSRYQSVHNKKTFIRLEQESHAYMNRLILRHGAFAVLYGHHLKYFIRNPEVSLGRATEDVKVDIDLGREGRANKISRRQAIIKMDEDGSFLLKNIGKCSVFVNSKEVQSKKRLYLSSGSLIEIRDLRFIFESNPNAVRHYITARKGSGQGLIPGFEFYPSQNP